MLVSSTQACTEAAVVQNLVVVKSFDVIKPKELAKAKQETAKKPTHGQLQET